ncbi:MAG: phage virion morphogenesis protein [Treponemataceae bacterium]
MANFATVDIKEISALKKTLEELRLSDRDSQRLMGDIGVELESSMSERIAREKTSPDGKAWAKIKDSTRALYKKNGTTGSLLFRKGFLSNTLESQATSTSVLVGATMAYAPFLQDGTSKMVARPFIGVSKNDEHLLLCIVQDFLRRSI